MLLARYGRRFPSRRELQRRVGVAFGRYLWMLGKQTAKTRPWRDPEFREHHAQALARIGREFDEAGLAAPAALARWVGAGLGRAGSPQPDPGWAFR